MLRAAPKLAIILVAVFVLAFSACGDFFVSQSSTDHITMSATALILSNNASSGSGGESKQLTATAVTVGGTSTDVSSSATWTSSNASVASVNASGTVTAVAPGTATISAKSGGVAGTATVLVVSSPLKTLAVSPSSVNLHTTSGPSTQQLAAVATLENGTQVTVTPFASWSSSNTSTATVSSSGLVTGVPNTSSFLGTPSTATITASVSGASAAVTGTSNINVDAQ